MTLNIANTNFEFGLSNRNQSELMGAMGQLDPTTFQTLFDDFASLNNDVGVTTPTYSAALWLPANTVDVGADGDVALSSALSGGVVLLTPGTTVADNAQIQTTQPAFQLVEGKRVFFKVRYQSNHTTSSTYTIGLTGSEVTSTLTDGIGITKVPATQSPTFVNFSSGSPISSEATNAVLVNDTWHELVFAYDGVDKLSYSIGNAQGSIDASSFTSAFLGPRVYAETSSVNGLTLSVDYILCAQER